MCSSDLLRSPTEIAVHPDPEVPGAENLHFDAIGIPIERLSSLTSRAEAVALMDEVYRGFVVEEHCRTAFGGVLRQLAAGGPQLFHCSQGKDRTGWVAALLLHVAGVDDPTIESDYLLTNARSAASRARVEAEIEAFAGSVEAARRRLAGVIRFTMPPEAVEDLMSNPIRLFMAQHPAVKIEVLATHSFLDIAAGDADIALRAGRMPTNPALIVRKAANIEWT